MSGDRRRGLLPPSPESIEKTGLPPRPFLYTIDQISVLLNLEEQTLRSSLLHYEGRSIGFASRDHLLARNIAMPDATPDWRVAERELIRWMKRKGFKYYERGMVTH